MRAAFGLAGLLAFLIAVILFWNYAYLPYTQSVVRQGQTAQSTAAQIAGVDSELGGRVTQHLRFDPVSSGNQLRGLKVMSVDRGSSFEQFYGIRPGDLIDRIGPQSVKDIGDYGMARALAYEAYQRQWELHIIRNNKPFTLPQEAQAAAAAAGFVIAPNPSTPAPAQATAQPGAVVQPQPAQQANTKQPPAPAPNPNQQPANNQNSLSRQLDAITNYGQRENP